MHKILLVILLTSISTFGQNHSQMKVMVLGTFHFGESYDFQQGKMDDLFTRKRQKELKDLRKDLAKFNPDKIFVENTPSYQGFWDNIYAKWKNGQEPKEEEILSSEIFQIGIKLASEMQAENGVSCINYLMDEPSSSNNAVARSFNFYKKQISKYKPTYGDYLNSNSLVKSRFDHFIKEHEQWKSLKLKAHLLKMNEEANLRELHYFNVLGWMDNNTNGVGTDLTSLEYYRNLQILQNIYKNLKPTDKNLLIIIGAAHAQILKDMLKSHPVFELVEVSDYLK